MLNEVRLIGNLGKDPEVKSTSNGNQVASLSVGTSSRYKDKSGQYQEKTEWHKVVVWGKTAEFCGKYLSKGSKVYVGGRIETRKWQNKDGVDQYTTEIIADTVQSLSHKSEGKRQHDTDQFQSTGDVPF